jgi:hypothetical protein
VKSIGIAFLALSLTLCGCVSSPSLEDEAKLKEYESCLAAYRGQLIENLNRYQMPLERDDELINGSTKYAIEKCAEFRPKQ